MPNLDDLFKEQPKKNISVDSIEIFGTFQCQSCEKQVDIAEYFRNEAVARWQCEDGHKSQIPFRL